MHEVSRECVIFRGLAWGTAGGGPVPGISPRPLAVPPATRRSLKVLFNKLLPKALRTLDVGGVFCFQGESSGRVVYHVRNFFRTLGVLGRGWEAHEAGPACRLRRFWAAVHAS